MPQEQVQEIKLFRGLKDDEDKKQIPLEYFVNCSNVNYADDGIMGIVKILFPDQTKSIGAASIDGLFEYRYLNQSGSLITENISVTSGVISTNCLTTGIASIKTGLQTGLCTFASYQDNLFISNGKDNVQVYYGSLGVVSEMGAPAAVLNTTTTGAITAGTHIYALTYVDAAGIEEVIGSISNIITATSTKTAATLDLPLGYSGTATRKVYRTRTGIVSSTGLLLLGSIANNTTLTYIDNIADASLSTAIPAANTTGALMNTLPKPPYLAVAGQSLYGTGASLYPTQIFKTGVNNEVFDAANFIDVSNYGNDNTPVRGIGVDFNQVIAGTDKQMYLIVPSDTIVNVTTVKPTRANVGVKNHFTMVSIPAGQGFPGGLMFVSSIGDVRVMSGVQGTNIPTTVDNVSTENWGQNIRGSLNIYLKSYSTIYAGFFQNKYHLAIDNTFFVFDIRTQGWTKHDIRTTTYQCKPRCFATLANNFYIGTSTGMIEKSYINVQYRSEDVNAFVQSPDIAVSNKYKYAKNAKWWFKPAGGSTITTLMTIDSNSAYTISANLTLAGGAYIASDYNTDFDTSSGEMDYKVLNINKPFRWMNYYLSCLSGSFNLQNVQITGYGLRDKGV